MSQLLKIAEIHSSSILNFSRSSPSLGSLMPWVTIGPHLKRKLIALSAKLPQDINLPSSLGWSRWIYTPRSKFSWIGDAVELWMFHRCIANSVVAHARGTVIILPLVSPFPMSWYAPTSIWPNSCPYGQQMFACSEWRFMSGNYDSCIKKKVSR